MVRIGTILAGLCLIIGLLLQCLNILCFDRGFYKAEYEKLGTAASIGMSQEDLDKTTEVLLDYIQDKREDLNVTAVVQGEERQVFNQREKDHMVDVKALYLNAMTASYWLLAVGGVVFIVFLSLRTYRRTALRGYLDANWVFLVIFGALALYAAVDFNSFWVNFHHVFFTNDLWLLDPRQDILIMMVPGQFFFDLVMRIVILAVGVIALLLLGAALWNRRIKRKEQTNAI